MKLWWKLLMALAPLGTWASTATLTWTHPTTNTDGSAIPATGPGSLTATIIEWGTCSGTAFGTAAGSQSVAAPATTYTVSNLSPGVWCFRARSRNTYGVESAWSNSVQKTIVPPTPNPPALTVAVVAGINRAPIFRLTATGGRSGPVAGFAPVGAACTGDVLFRYRGVDYRRLADWSTVQWWGTNPTTNAAAPCA